MGVLPQVLEIIFKCKGHGVKENNKEKKEAFQVTKNIVFFFFLSLWTPLGFKPHDFLISYSF